MLFPYCCRHSSQNSFPQTSCCSGSLATPKQIRHFSSSGGSARKQLSLEAIFDHVRCGGAHYLAPPTKYKLNFSPELFLTILIYLNKAKIVAEPVALWTHPASIDGDIVVLMASSLPASVSLTCYCKEMEVGLNTKISLSLSSLSSSPILRWAKPLSWVTLASPSGKYLEQIQKRDLSSFKPLAALSLLWKLVERDARDTTDIVTQSSFVGFL